MDVAEVMRSMVDAGATPASVGYAVALLERHDVGVARRAIRVDIGGVMLTLDELLSVDQLEGFLEDLLDREDLLERTAT